MGVVVASFHFSRVYKDLFCLCFFALQFVEVEGRVQFPWVVFVYIVLVILLAGDDQRQDCHGCFYCASVHHYNHTMYLTFWMPGIDTKIITFIVFLLCIVKTWLWLPVTQFFPHHTSTLFFLLFFTFLLLSESSFSLCMYNVITLT